MSDNYFGRDNQKDEKYADLHASIMRIANKSAEQEPEAKGFKDISDQQAMLNVQDAYKRMNQPQSEPEKQELKEGTALQVKMALDDAGLKGSWKNNKVHVKKKDVKKAEKALKGNVIYKGKPPVVVGEEIQEGIGEAHKVECPKCEGEGCEHCDGKGYHIKEASTYRDRVEDEAYGGTKKWEKGQNKMKKAGVTLRKKDRFSGYVEKVKMDEGDMKADKEAGIKWVDDPDWKKLHEMDLQMIKDYLRHKDEDL